MKCLILAAGYATRLYPLTENFPKPLLKVKDKTILDWLLDDVSKTGVIDEYIIVSNHKFVDFFNEWKDTRKEKITIVDDGTMSNETRLGAVADINLVINKLGINEDLLVMAGDNVLDFSLSKFIDYYKQKKKTCMMGYYEKDVGKIKKASNVIFDDNNKIIEMLEKPENPKSNYSGTAFYIYSKDDISEVKNAIEDGCKIDAPGSFISYLCKKKDVYVYKMPGSRYDIGNLESYEYINKNYEGIIK